MNDLIKWAKKLRPYVEKAAISLDDLDASSVPELFPMLKNNGALVTAGTRINWYGVVKRAAVDLWDTENNNPDNAPALWENIAYKDGIRYIPETITVTSAFAKEELGWWGEELYKSLIDNNVWTPTAYPAGWEKQN